MRRENPVIDGAQGIPECRRACGLVVGHERAQQPVMHLGIEDREAQAALKCLKLAIISPDPTGKGRLRWSNRWKAASERL